MHYLHSILVLFGKNGIMKNFFGGGGKKEK